MGSRGLPSIVVTRSSPTTCCCLHLRFLQTVPGTLKLAQLMIGSLCETLLVTYGLSYSSVIGPAFVTLLNTVSSCIWTTSLLMACYILSLNSYGLIRSSLLEPIFSVIAALSLLSGSIYMFFSVKLYLYPLYLVTIGFAAYPAMMASYEPIFSVIAALSLLSGSIYMFFSVKLYLYPLYLVIIGFAAYPAMLASYMLGFVLTGLYGLDAYHAYRHYKGYQ